MKNRIESLRVALTVIFLASFASATTEATDVHEVRETWQLQLDTPNVVKNTPQFVTHFKIDEDTFILTCINFREHPVHEPGGIQFQLWDQAALVDTVDVELDSLNVSNDTITWNQRYFHDFILGELEADILNLNSQAWGQISGTAHVEEDPCSVSNLNDYDPAESVAESHINFGHNAVIWFGMTGYATYDEHGNQLSTDSTARTVFAR